MVAAMAGTAPGPCRAPTELVTAGGLAARAGVESAAAREVAVREVEERVAAARAMAWGNRAVAWVAAGVMGRGVAP